MKTAKMSTPSNVPVFQKKPPCLTKKIIVSEFNEKSVKIAEISRVLTCCSYNGMIYLDEFDKWQNRICKSHKNCSLIAQENKFIEFSCILCRFF